MTEEVASFLLNCRLPVFDFRTVLECSAVFNIYLCKASVSERVGRDSPTCDFLESTFPKESICPSSVSQSVSKKKENKGGAIRKVIKDIPFCASFSCRGVASRYPDAWSPTRRTCQLIFKKNSSMCF